MQPSSVLDPVMLLQLRAAGEWGPRDWIVEPRQDATGAIAAETVRKASPASIAIQLAQQALRVQDWLRQHAGDGAARDREKAIASYRILIVSAEPLTLLAWFCAAVSTSVPVFLGNPQWTPAELQRVIDEVNPRVVAGLPLSTTSDLQNFSNSPQFFHSFPQACGNLLEMSEITFGKGFDLPCLEANTHGNVENFGIFIPTGGSSGELRFAQHSWQTLRASVAGLRESKLMQGNDPIDSFCLLPLYHVSGLMQFVRSLTSGGYFALALGSPEHPCPLLSLPESFPQLRPETFWISLVPTQLQRLLQDEAAAQWLGRFRMVLLGGAPAWPNLLHRAREKHIALAPTYGMTETASQVVTLAPQDFGVGQVGCGQVLPHAQVNICDASGRSLPPGQIGQVRVRSRSLAQGYFVLAAPGTEESATAAYQPFPRDEQGPFLETDDLGCFDAAGYLKIVGRSSDKIISGGENVFPAEVEAAIRATGKVADVAVMGMPDGDWGERVVAVYVPNGDGARAVDETAIQALNQILTQAIAQVLSPAKRPKTWLSVEALPRNAQGKLNRKLLRALVTDCLQGKDSSPNGKD